MIIDNQYQKTLVHVETDVNGFHDNKGHVGISKNMFFVPHAIETLVFLREY